MMEGHGGQEPAQIALIVHEARNLQNKKKETCHASVVFGLGKELYKTLTVESNNPQWKEEGIINVPHKVHNGVLKFRVRDQDHALGAVHLNIAELTRSSSKQWYPILPSKKPHEAVGELLIEYHVKEYRPYDQKHSPIPSHSTSQEDISASVKVGGASASGAGVGGGGGGVKGRFSLHHRTSSWTSKGRSSSTSAGSDRSQSMSHTPVDLSPSPTHEKRLTGSDIELHSKSSLITYQSDSNLRGYSLYDSSSDRSPEQTRVLDSNEKERASLVPEVTGISPREGPVEGNQRVILRGSNLGEFKSDIVKVVIAGVDCTSTLEYFSPSKLAVTTSARHTTGSGPVIIETVSGGTGKSSVAFTFTGTEHGQPPEVTGISPREGPVEGDQRVVLRGSNLGESKSDVVKVVIAGVDCTSTLEYFSPAKLVVITLPRSSPGSGPVVVETERGGVVESSLTFSYVPTDDSAGGGGGGGGGSTNVGGGVVGGAGRLSSFSGAILGGMTESPLLSNKRAKQSELDQAEIKSLKQQVKDLKNENAELVEENKSLKAYIEQLLLNIMDSRPDILEFGKLHPPQHSSNGIMQ